MENYTNVLNCTKTFDAATSNITQKHVDYFKNNFTTTDYKKTANVSVYNRPIIKQKVLFNKKGSCKSIKNKNFGDSDFGNNDFLNKKSPLPSATIKAYQVKSKKMEYNLNIFRCIMLSSLIFDGISTNKQITK